MEVQRPEMDGLATIAAIRERERATGLRLSSGKWCGIILQSFLIKVIAKH